MTSESSVQRATTGIEGLDRITLGGLPRGRSYLVHGEPGTGKTTLSLQFLREGTRRGESVLYVSLLQSADELAEVVASHGWSLDGIEVLELPDHLRDASTARQTLFETSDVELNEVSDIIARTIENRRLDRVVIDSLSELALLVDTPAQLRHHLLRLKLHLAKAGATAILTAAAMEQQLGLIETLVHGSIRLRRDKPVFGKPTRRLELTKLRGSAFAEGLHDFRIRCGGIEVFPRLQVDTAAAPRIAFEPISSGIAELDEMVGGGLETGTACLISGASGTGKSTLATTFIAAAAERGDRSVVYCFDERRATFIARSEHLGIPILKYVESGRLVLEQIDVGEISPGEFVEQVRRAVTTGGSRVVVIDSLNGYVNAMPGQRELLVQLHELLSYLGTAGVLTLMVATGSGGNAGIADIDASYIADSLLLMQHVEAGGHLRRCLSVVKKRHGPHESSVREVVCDRRGMHLGPPLPRFSGLLSSIPTFQGDETAVFDNPDRHRDEGNETNAR